MGMCCVQNCVANISIWSHTTQNRLYKMNLGACRHNPLLKLQRNTRAAKHSHEQSSELSSSDAHEAELSCRGTCKREGDGILTEPASYWTEMGLSDKVSPRTET